MKFPRMRDKPVNKGQRRISISKWNDILHDLQHSSAYNVKKEVVVGWFILSKQKENRPEKTKVDGKRAGEDNYLNIAIAKQHQQEY